MRILPPLRCSMRTEVNMRYVVPSRILSQQGTAATEVLLLLPFFLVVTLLGVNFSKAFLLQHRATAAACRAAEFEARTGLPMTETRLQRLGYGGYEVQLISQSDDPEPQLADMTLPDLTTGATTVDMDFPTDYSSTSAAIQVSYRWRPLGSFLPEAQPTDTCTLTLADWRYRDGEGKLDKWLHTPDQIMRTIVDIVSK